MLTALSRRFGQWFERRIDAFPEDDAFDARQPVPRRFFPFLWSCARGSRRWLLAMTFCTALVGAFEAALFALMGRLVDWLSQHPAETFWQARSGTLIAMAVLLLASVVLVAVSTQIKHQVLAGNFPMRLRWRFHRLMLRQSMGFYQDEFAGRVATRVMQTALAVRDCWFILGSILVFVAIYFLTLTSVLATFNAWLVVPFAVWLLCYAATLGWFVPRLARIGQRQADARSMMTGRIADAYTNIGTVKLFSHANRESGWARGAMHEFLGAVHGQMRLVSGVEVANHTLSMLLVLATTGVALTLWSGGTLGVGAVAAATAMALRLNGMSHWVMWEMTSLFEQVGTVQDGITTLSRPHAVVDAPAAQPLTVHAGRVRFEDVRFGYGGEHPVIDDLCLDIAPGEKIGLIGRSGAGKSTLVNLLLRFHDPEGGRILIDGQDIRAVTQESLRAQIGMVTQDTSLLHRSVRDNILYGRPQASDAEMIRAAERAQAMEFIPGLSDAQERRGFEAHVGERGVKLSGGQRQRIAIARVILKDAPVLVLDEATSALDSEVEGAIQASLAALMEGKTVIAIAHRLSTIAALDRLIVLDGGRIVEQGDHAALLAAGGLYARLWARQSGGFLGED